MGQVLNALPPGPAGTDGAFPYPPRFQTPGLTSEGPSINGQPMPGQWLLKKCTRTFGLQKQRPVYMDGAVLVPTGAEPMQIEYEVRIWESGTFAIFRGLVRTLLKRPAVSLGAAVPISAALGIDDPILKDLGVTNVLVEFVNYPLNPLVSSGGKGPWVGSVGFIEWVAKPKITTPPSDQGIPDPGAVTPSAATNLATAGASVTAGASALQSRAAQALVPPR